MREPERSRRTRRGRTDAPERVLVDAGTRGEPPARTGERRLARTWSIVRKPRIEAGAIMHRTTWTASVASLATVLFSVPAAAQSCPQSTMRYSLVIPTLVDAENVSVSSIEDLDNDGARDLVIGIPGGPFGGRVEIWSTLNQTQIISFAPSGTTPKASFGWDVVAVDDVDGDPAGLEDVLVGAPHDFAGASAPSTSHGVAFVYSSTTGALLQTIQPSTVWVTP